MSIGGIILLLETVGIVERAQAHKPPLDMIEFVQDVSAWRVL
jgi:hypothetical protein